VVTDQVNSALHPSSVAKSSTSSVPRHVLSRSGEVISTNCYTAYFTLLYFNRIYIDTKNWMKIKALKLT